MRFLTRILAPLTLFLAILLSAGGALADPPVRGEEFSTDINTCNGEVVALEGRFQFFTIEQKDGSFIQHLTLHAQGVGDQGNEYVLNVVEHNTSDDGLVQRRLLVSKGSAPNQWLLITLPPTGGIFIESDCRG